MELPKRRKQRKRKAPAVDEKRVEANKKRAVKPPQPETKTPDLDENSTCVEWLLLSTEEFRRQLPKVSNELQPYLLMIRNLYTIMKDQEKDVRAVLQYVNSELSEALDLVSVMKEHCICSSYTEETAAMYTKYMAATRDLVDLIKKNA